MARKKLLKECLCCYCEGCYRVKTKDFNGTYNCRLYRPGENKKVWCADEAVNKYNKTGNVK